MKWFLFGLGLILILVSNPLRIFAFTDRDIWNPILGIIVAVALFVIGLIMLFKVKPQTYSKWDC